MPVTPIAPVPPEHRRRLERLRGVLRALWTGFWLLLLLFIFAKLASEVREGDTGAFDMLVLRFFQDLRLENPWLTEALRDLSGLGGTVVLVLFTAIAAGYLVLVREQEIAMLVIATTAGCEALVEALKLAFGRSRPEASYAAFAVPGLSFPSGHATLSAIVFLTLGALASSTRHRAVERAYILSAAAGMTFLVGLSRIALGVHWATDVLAGWAFGALGAATGLLIARRFAPAPPVTPSEAEGGPA